MIDFLARRNGFLFFPLVRGFEGRAARLASFAELIHKGDLRVTGAALIVALRATVIDLSSPVRLILPF